MIHARRASDGSLYEISHREATYPDDVPLDAMPSGFGPFALDGRKAVPHVTLIAAREAEKSAEAEIQAEIRTIAIEQIAARKALST